MKLTSPEFLKQNQTFLEFLKNNGAVLSDRFVIEDYSQEFAGRGIKATCDLEPETELFSIPYHLCLSPDTSRIKSWVHNEPELWKHEWAPSITAVLYEYCFADSSFWKPYFDILPKQLDTPIFWTNEELDHLEGTETLYNLGKEECECLFTDVIFPILRKHVPSEESLSCLTLEKFHYAGSLLMAYGFQWNPGSMKKKDKEEEENESSEEEDEDEDACMPVLVPLADTLNADTPSSAHLVYLSDDRIAMKTSCFIPANLQIYNTYGERSASDRLRRYGYVEWQSKQHDFVSISIDVLMKVITEYLGTHSKALWETSTNIEKELNNRLRYLERHGFLHESFDVTFSKPIPDTLLTTLRLLLLPPLQWNMLRKKHCSLLNSCSKQNKYLTASEFDLLNKMGHLRLDQYPSNPMYSIFKSHFDSVTDMSSYLKQKHASSRIAMAYFVRIQEVRVLNCFLKTVRKKFKDCTSEISIETNIKKKKLFA